MKFCRVAWLNGDILYVEHLENSNQMLAEYALNISNVNFGIRTLEIDKVAFAAGHFSIKEVSCLFSDGSLVNFNGEYELSYEMQPDDAVQGRQLYLGVEEEVTNREIKLHDGALINMPVYIPKLEIFTTPQESRIPVAKILLKGGTFAIDEECIKFAKVDVKKRIESLLFSLQNLFLVESDKSEVDSLFLSHINCTIALLMGLILENDPKAIYKGLLSCLGSVAWKTGKQIQFSSGYDESFPLKTIDQLFNKINEILDYVSVSYKKVEFVNINGLFVSTIDNFEQYENLIIVAEPFSEQGVQELFSCIICSEDCLDEARKKRTFAMNRKKQKDEMKFIVPLQGQFFNAKGKLVCDINISKFTRLAFYVK